MVRIQKKHILVNIFGTLFYMVCAVQWLWASLPVLPDIIRFTTTLQPTPTPTEPVKQVVVSGPMSSTNLIIVTIITVIIIAVTIYILMKLPSAVGKTGAKLTNKASHYIMPVVSHHAKLTPKKRQWLTTRLKADIKLTLCVVPVLLVVLSYFVHSSLPYDITMFIAAVLAIVAIVFLCLQQLFVRLWRVSPEKVW